MESRLTVHDTTPPNRLRRTPRCRLGCMLDASGAGSVILIVRHED